MSRDLAAVVLAAGSGERLSPLTTLLPKALCPVGNRPLVDHAVGRVRGVLSACGVGPGAGSVAVNVHHGRDAMVAHLAAGAHPPHLSLEETVALGTAGGVGNLRHWIDGRDVLVANADVWSDDPVASFAEGWEGEHVRLLVVPAGERRADFGSTRYAGMCLLPAAVAASLAPEPSGLYEVLWREEWAAGRLDLFERDVAFVDCGSPGDYLDANLRSAAVSSIDDCLVDPAAHLGRNAVIERSVIGSGAEVHGPVVDSVVWPNSVVHPGERLVRGIRAGTLTVLTR